MLVGIIVAWRDRDFTFAATHGNRNRLTVIQFDHQVFTRYWMIHSRNNLVFFTFNHFSGRLQRDRGLVTIVFNRGRRRAAGIQVLVVTTLCTSNTHRHGLVALLVGIIVAWRDRDFTFAATHGNRNRLTVIQFDHQVFTRYWMIHSRNNLVFFTFNHFSGRLQRDRGLVAIVFNRGRRRAAGVQVLVITTLCTGNTYCLWAITLLIDIIWVRIFNSDTALCTANRDRNSAAIGQRNDQILTCDWLPHTGNDLVWITFRNVIWSLQRNDCSSSHQCWIFITTGISTQAHVFNGRHIRTWVLQGQRACGFHNADQAREAAATAFATTGQDGSRRIQLCKRILPRLQSRQYSSNGWVIWIGQCSGYRIGIRFCNIATHQELPVIGNRHGRATWNLKLNTGTGLCDNLGVDRDTHPFLYGYF